MLGWFQKWRTQREDDYGVAQNLFARHGGQARHILAEQIREQEVKGQDSRKAWAIMGHLRKLDGSDGLDTATRISDAP